MTRLFFNVLYNNGVKETYETSVEEAVANFGEEEVKITTEEELINNIITHSITNNKHATLELKTVDGFSHVIDVRSISRLSYMWK